MTSQSLVKMDGVSKRFGSAIALEHLSLEIQQGEFVTFLGPSGCGKSTTLRILGGFERPDTGRVILNGEDVTCLLYTSPSPRDVEESRMPSSA